MSEIGLSWVELAKENGPTSLCVREQKCRVAGYRLLSFASLNITQMIRDNNDILNYIITLLLLLADYGLSDSTISIVEVIYRLLQASRTAEYVSL